MSQRIKNSTVFFVGLVSAQSIGAIDLQPGDITAPAPNIQLMQYSYFNSERGAFYSNNKKLYSNAKIANEQAIIRYGRSFEVSQLPAFFYVQSSVGTLHPQGSLSSYTGDSGVGDTTLALGLWPYANRETNTYFALGAYLTAPTGSYSSSRLFNMGQNRYSTALQIGYQTSPVKQLHWMNAIDVASFSENDASKNALSGVVGSLKQKNLYTAQTGLFYKFNQTYSIGGVYFHSAGGRTSFNGAINSDLTQLNRYQLSAIAMLPIGKLTLQWGKDADTKNGYIENSRTIVRYTNYF